MELERCTAASHQLLRRAEFFRKGDRTDRATSVWFISSNLNPKSATPQLYLALGWIQLYVPGDSSPENVGLARLAEAALRRAVELEPGNRSGFVLLGMLARDENRLEETRTSGIEERCVKGRATQIPGASSGK